MKGQEGVPNNSKLIYILLTSRQGWCCSSLGQRVVFSPLQTVTVPTPYREIVYIFMFQFLTLSRWVYFYLRPQPMFFTYMPAWNIQQIPKEKRSFFIFDRFNKLSRTNYIIFILAPISLHFGISYLK